MGAPDLVRSPHSLWLLEEGYAALLVRREGPLHGILC
jgi:hypothetical protein